MTEESQLVSKVASLNARHGIAPTKHFVELALMAVLANSEELAQAEKVLSDLRDRMDESQRGPEFCRGEVYMLYEFVKELLEPQLTDDERKVMEAFRSDQYDSVSLRFHDIRRVTGFTSEKAYEVVNGLCVGGLLERQSIQLMPLILTTPAGKDYLRDHEPAPASQ